MNHPKRLDTTAHRTTLTNRTGTVGPSRNGVAGVLEPLPCPAARKGHASDEAGARREGWREGKERDSCADGMGEGMVNGRFCWGMLSYFVCVVGRLSCCRGKKRVVGSWHVRDSWWRDGMCWPQQLRAARAARAFIALIPGSHRARGAEWR